MRTLAAGTLMLMLMGLALPLCAQRGGGARGGGGFAARSAPSMSGGLTRGGFSSGGSGARPFNSPMTRSFNAPVMRTASPYRAMPAARGYAANGRPTAGVRYGYPTRGGYPYNRGRGYGARFVPVYPYGVSAWVAPWDLGYPDADFGYDLNGYNDSAPLPPDNSIEAPQVEDDAAYPQTGYAPSAPPAPNDAVTLVFKDGRSPQHVRNYMLTRSTLTVVEGRRMRDIPLGDLDLQATVDVNRKAGVPFKLLP